MSSVGAFCLQWHKHWKVPVPPLLAACSEQLSAAALNRIRSSGAALLGLVTNAVKQEKVSNSSYGYGRYGYGYGGYDPRTTYSYYQGGDTAAKPAKIGRIRQWRQSLMRWLDA